MTGARTIPAAIEALARHVETALGLADHDVPGPFRGAVNVATVAAYWLAATTAASEEAHAAKVTALRSFLASVEPDQRPFRGSLIDAALALEFDARVARGAPVLSSRMRGWMDDPASASPTNVPTGSAPSRRVVEACAGAAHLDDVDAGLLRTLALTRALRIAAERGEARDGLLDDYERVAMALCVGPPTADAVDEARWLLVHQYTFLRRRRPLAAAVVRARLRWRRMRRERPPSDPPSP